MAGSGRHDCQGVYWGMHLGVYPFPGVLFALMRAATCQLCTHQAAGATAEHLGGYPGVQASLWRLSWSLQCLGSLSHGLSWLSRFRADGTQSPKALRGRLGLGKLPGCAWEQRGAGGRDKSLLLEPGGHSLE